VSQCHVSYVLKNEQDLVPDLKELTVNSEASLATSASVLTLSEP
jgi:hypothetical protein